jgi:Zn-dependent metalloprotease
MWFTQVYSDALRLLNPAQDLQFVRRSEDDNDLFFRQRYAGIPVLGSEINIHLLSGHITGVSGSYLSDLQLDPTSQIPPERARQIALALGNPGASILSEDQLRLLNRSLFVDEAARTFLAWLVVLDQGGGTEFYIDANTGALRLQQPRDLAGFDLDLQTVNHNSGAGNYCQHYWWTTDDDSWCDENGCNGDATQEGINAYNYIKKVYDYWQTYLGRDSYDDDGEEIDIYMNVGTNWDNAHWLGGCDFFEFGDGNAVLDIMGHEFTHAVTDYTSDLVYQDEPGALNESFSDINGAFVDYGDWLIGEDTPGGASRSMANPTLYGDPDRYNSPLKIASGTSWDYGGVHENSGINNHAAYLVTEGGDFNGVHIPYGGISMWRARVLFYKTLKRLTSNASMLDARNAALASAKEMAQQNTNGFTTSMICIVRNAYHAVELGDGDIDCDGIEDSVDSDQDGDKVSNSQDNCSTVSNPDQKNTDKDSQGDACDTDDDNDGDLDTVDNCPLVSNSNQLDTNGDGEGDACDDNDDNDLIPDAQDNCPLVTNHDQLDTDGDGQGDACDNDDDNDWVNDIYDNCSLVSNYNQANNDGDPFGDACDLCPNYYGTDNGDPDNDGKGNSCDEDDDNDGVLDGVDNCPEAYNPEQHDLDGDGKGWACDSDDADALLAKLKTLTLQYNRSKIRFPLPGCGSCGGGYIDPDYRQRINLFSQVGLYAQVVDSTGRVVDHSNFGGGVLLNQSLSFQPAPFANPGMTGLFSRPETSSVNLLSDEMRYYLEVFPDESLEPGQTYTLTIQVQDMFYQTLYLPTIRK